MKKETLYLDNIKCSGCGNTIVKKLKSIPGVTAIEVDPETGKVAFQATEPIDLKALESALTALGYPPKGTSTGFQTARSYVSCAIGRVSGPK